MRRYQVEAGSLPVWWLVFDALTLMLMRMGPTLQWRAHNADLGHRLAEPLGAAPNQR